MAAVAATPLFIKNTFIDVFEPEAEVLRMAANRRRTKSVPPSYHFFATISALLPCKVECDEDKVSVVSTSETTYVPTSEDEYSPGSSAGTEFVNSPANSDSTRRRTGRAKLSSNAEAWAPPVPMQDPGLTEFLGEVAQVQHLAMAAAEADQRVARVDSVSTWEGLCIRIHPREGQSDEGEALLAIVQAAMLQAADLSKCAYVLGYGGAPFTAVPGGFSLTIGALWDESRACWDTYRWGACRRGCGCRWQHPPYMAPLQVLVAPPPGA